MIGCKVVSVAALGLFLLSSSGCGDDAEPQRFDLSSRHDLGSSTGCQNCFGCCQNGQCMTGNTISACGIGGLTCRTCTAQQQCINNSCQTSQPTCGPTGCSDGCCSSQGVCVRPPNETNCGFGGNPCAPCTSGKICNTTTGACDDPVSKQYTVTLVSARITWNCDTVGSCDPYALVALGSGQQVTSSILEGTNEPAWNEQLFEASETALLTSKLSVTIVDDDGLLGTENIDTCSIQITRTELAAGEIVTPCGQSLGAERVQDLKFSFAEVTTPDP